MKDSNYKLLRLSGHVLTGLSFLLLLMIAFAIASNLAERMATDDWFVTPIPVHWLIPIVGLALGQLCRAVADIADGRTQPA